MNCTDGQATLPLISTGVIRTESVRYAHCFPDAVYVYWPGDLQRILNEVEFYRIGAG